MRLDFLKSDRFWKWVLWTGIGIFLLTRLLMLDAFPIFNDEGIYLQYSQMIQEDFGKYKFISAGLNEYLDWKPPLQYWLGSVFINMTPDPLLSGRLVAFFVSLFGLWGLYLFIKELWGQREAAVAILLYALLPTALFSNIQFTAETFIFSLAPWMYWFFLKAIRSDKVRLGYALVAAIFGALILLSKQSGMVYVMFSLLLPLVALDRQRDGDKDAERPMGWRGFLVRVGVVAGSILAALILRRLALSAEAAGMEGRFNSAWLMSPQDLLRFPLTIWQTNWISIRDYYYHYYSVFILLPILYFFAVTLRQLKWKNIALGLGFLGGSAAVLLLLRGFNEYIYNTAVIVFLVPILVSAFFAALEAAPGFWRAAGRLTLVSFALLLAHWGYQDVLMKASSADYIRRSTPWANSGYIENWSSGFGVAEAIAYVAAQETPALVLADAQWGNPRTALEVYNQGSKEFQVLGLTADFQSAAGTLKAKAYISEFPFKTRMVVFSTATNELRASWQINVEKYLCDSRTEIQVEPTQPPIVICRF